MLEEEKATNTVSDTIGWGKGGGGGGDTCLTSVLETFTPSLVKCYTVKPLTI